MFENEYDIEQTESEATPIARCADCGELIYDEGNDAYVDGEKNYFCSLECALRFYDISIIEE